MITMTEIARLTNVSQPTVSRVLNGNRNVSADIRERVLACAREHDYQPNVLAKGLQGSKTKLLGLLVADLADGFSAGLAKEIEAEARKSGYSVLLSGSGCDVQSERDFLDVVRRYRVDGVLVSPSPENAGTWREHAKRLDAPVVAVARRAEGIDSIYVDPAQAGALAAEHLAGRGYQRFLFLGREDDAKYAGFRQALAGRGSGTPAASALCEDSAQLQKAFRAWFRGGWGRAAVFAGTDGRALQVLDALRSLGLSVPGNVGVMGFGGSDAGRYSAPRLTSVSQPVEELAREAVARLLERIERPERGEPWERPLPPSLTVREST